MNRVGNVVDLAAHFDCQHRFGDQLAGARADDTTADNSVRLRINEPLGQTIGGADRLGPPAGRPWIDFDVDLAARLFRFIFGQSRPCDFGGR